MSNKARAAIEKFVRQAGQLLMPVPAGGNSEYLGTQHFARVVLLVVALHGVAFYSWYRMPRQQVLDIPVRALNIKLGDIDMMPDAAMNNPQSNPTNSKEVENTLSKLVEDVPVKEAAKDSAKSNASADVVVSANGKKEAAKKDQDYLSKLATQPKQFVRNSQEAQMAQTAKKMNLSGSASGTAEILSRYEQLISTWILKFQVYPDEARNRGWQGETVVRIRIDRRGNIGYYILERSTGYQVLDKAAIDMIKRANPVPAVPRDYPPGDSVELLIPVGFYLN